LPMSNVPANLKYARSHEWIRLEGDNATVGITDHAQQELTDVVFVELPKVGRKVKAGEACAVVESVKTASDIYSPAGGEVIEVNKELPDNLDWLATDPFGKAWMIKVKVTAETKDGMDSTAYDAHCAAEGH